MLVAFYIYFQEQWSCLLQGFVQRGAGYRYAVGPGVVEHMVHGIEVAGKMHFTTLVAHCFGNDADPLLRLVGVDVLLQPMQGCRYGFEAIHTGTYLCSGQYAVGAGVGPNIGKAVLWPQQVQQKRHVFKFMQATIVVAGGTPQARCQPELAVVGPGYQFGCALEPCMPLPLYKPQQCLYRPAAAEGVLQGDEAEGAEEGHGGFVSW